MDETGAKGLLGWIKNLSPNREANKTAPKAVVVQLGIIKSTHSKETYYNFGLDGAFHKDWKVNADDNVIAIVGNKGIQDVARLEKYGNWDFPVGLMYSYKLTKAREYIDHYIYDSSYENIIGTIYEPDIENGDGLEDQGASNVIDPQNISILYSAPTEPGKYLLEIIIKAKEPAKVTIINSNGTFKEEKDEKKIINDGIKINRVVYIAKIVKIDALSKAERTKQIIDFNETYARTNYVYKEDLEELDSDEEKLNSAISLDSNEYCMPFKSFSLANFSQGFWGGTSHRGTHKFNFIGGIDIGTLGNEGIVLFSILDGTVETVADLNYANRTTIESTINNELYHLEYLHTEKDSSKHLKKGDRVKKGTPIGIVSGYKGYPIHLHLQIIKKTDKYDEKGGTITNNIKFRNNLYLDPLRIFDLERKYRPGHYSLIEFKALVADGMENKTTTKQLTLTFSSELYGLKEWQIDVSGGAKKVLDPPSSAVTLSGSGRTYYLAIKDVVGEGSNVTVTVTAQPRYTFPAPTPTKAQKTVQVHYVKPIVAEFIDLFANGEAYVDTTSKLTLYFTKKIEGLDENAFNVTGGVKTGKLLKGTWLDGNRCFYYTLEITYIPYPEGRHPVTLIIRKPPAGYTIATTARDVTVFKKRRR